MQGSGVASTSYGREITAMAAGAACDHRQGQCCDLRSMAGCAKFK